MTTKHPRINLVIEEPIFHILKDLSKANSLSLSSQVKNLVLKALEDIEDMGLNRIADYREKTFNRKNALSFDEMMKRLDK
ncbi:MAG: DUF6290 family protein [Elusimicrobiota bacterium]